ncbi:hypothetical protein [Pseudomonas sp. MF6768]|uniref:hypothetical protein n=1 Tax=Pseudomonas sp. MF6768 TaxID=2797532 RepID=UPI0018E71F16|nr:hypothetical protein [Pseudomonas sp. MF6768]MBJ2241711.1 hypothetical protein [Pseudomonas sp. MF6768]
MIIIINSEINIQLNTDSKIRALDNILSAHGEGKHAVWMPIETVEYLRTFDQLSSYSKRVLASLESTVIETRRIEKKFTFHIDVDFANGNRIESAPDKLVVGYNRFTDSGALQSSIFITENLLDANALVCGAAVHLLYNKLFAAFDVSLDSRPGGGSTTYDLFKDLTDQNKFILCIVDSDLKHPNGRRGSTAKRFKYEALGLQPTYQLEILDCHEIENILPINIVKDTVPHARVPCLIYSSDRYKSYRLYPDHKLGLQVSGARQLDSEYNSNYWSPFYDYDDEAWICAPLGESLLQNCVHKMKEMSAHKLSEAIDAEIDQEWIRLCKLVASWGVGMKRVIP